MPKTFNCPNCAASLDYDGGADYTIRCPYCTSSVIVPEELRTESTVGAVSGFGSLTGAMDRAVELAEIVSLVQAGKKIEAIKLYRKKFGVGLKQAKDAVDAIERGESVQFSNVTIESPRRFTLTQPANASRRWRAGRGFIVGLIGFIVAVTLLPLVLTPLMMAFTFKNVDSIIGDVTTRVALPNLPVATPTPRLATVLFKFGDSGTGPGYFNDARSIAVDGAGNIYVGEYQGGRIQVFDAGGKFITQWSIGEKTILRGMAAARQGIVYVVHSGEIQRYEGATGKPLDKLPYADGAGFDDVVVTADGGLVAAWQINRDDIVRFDSTGKAIKTITRAISSASGRSELNTRVAADGLGNIYALGTFNRAVFKFSSEGKFLNRFGGEGDAPGQFGAVLAIAVDNQSRVYVSDSSKGIQVFDKDGRYLDVIKADAPVFGMVFNGNNELLVAARTQVIKLRINLSKP